MIIDETPLSGRITIETGVWGGSSYTWTDQTSKVVNANYEEGGRLGSPGSSLVNTGSLAVVYRDMATVPAIGSLIRIRRTGTSEYAFTGYVQDVASKVTYDFSVSTSPITFTTLYCLDWVGYASQFQLLGIGGKQSNGNNAVDDGYHFLANRVNALNRFVDPTGATLFVTLTGSTSGLSAIQDTDRIGTMSDHLDLATISTGTSWAGTHVLPTNPTTGRDGLVELFTGTSSGSSGKTFTDGTGSAGELHYTEIDFESSSQNVANSIILKNRMRYQPREIEVIQVGGQDSKNFVEIDGQQRAGFMLDTVWKEENASSISTYGLRQSEVETCIAVAEGKLNSTYQNLVINPSAEYNGDGYYGGTDVAVRRAQPSQDATPFPVPSISGGSWAIRAVQKSAGTTALIGYDGSVFDGIPITTNRDYFFRMYAARGTPGRTDLRVRARLRFYDINDAITGTSFGSQVSLSSAQTWYEATVGPITPPAGSVRAVLAAEFNRSGGGNITVGDRSWVDNFALFSRGLYPSGSPATTNPPYFDGDTPSDSTYLYFWTGSPGASASYRETNFIDTRAVAILAQYADTSNRVTRIRWNAQESLSSVSALAVGKSVVVKYNGTTTTHRIIGISGSLDYSRYVIDYYLLKI
jgi:hypothetical protein